MSGGVYAGAEEAHWSGWAIRDWVLAPDGGYPHRPFLLAGSSGGEGELCDGWVNVQVDGGRADDV